MTLSYQEHLIVAACHVKCESREAKPDLISDHGDCLDSLDSLSETDKGEVEKFEGTDYECPAEEA